MRGWEARGPHPARQPLVKSLSSNCSPSNPNSPAHPAAPCQRARPNHPLVSGTRDTWNSSLLTEPQEGRRHAGPGVLLHSPLARAAGSLIHRSTNAHTCPETGAVGGRGEGVASQVQEFPLLSPQLRVSKNLNNRACCNYLKKGHTFFPSSPIQKYLKSENKSLRPV